MNKRKGFINELIEKESGDDDVKKLLSKMLDYYEIYDLAHETNHSKIFFDLYFERKKKYEEIANDNFIDSNTLSRYIKSYNDLALRIIRRYVEFKACR
jgi:hypothetical protein